ncbi:hypothetical protein NA57DRAFT_71896 [Rhizodiscina lignyota]|uniref:Uncharacterized protein n=1 Tax=Rhizodiscina lignyota TaxID=1504668 RepID=A0A9P4M9P2_9PEZI|nr:hypothetical protein NA57DRAFT_71896 [Rhizodiscina lignyota]
MAILNLFSPMKGNLRGLNLSYHQISPDGEPGQQLLHEQEKEDIENGFDEKFEKAQQWRKLFASIIALASVAILLAFVGYCFLGHTSTSSHESTTPTSAVESNLDDSRPPIGSPQGHSNSTDEPEFESDKANSEMFSSWKDCGSNAEQARSKGCHFDSMLSVWLHEDCRDTELMERYLSKGQYQWFRDISFESEIPDEEFRRGEHAAAVVRLDFHYAHCAYLWEMQMKAWTSGKPIVQSLFSYGHSVHCAGYLTEHSIPSNITKLAVGFDRCGFPDDSHRR